MHSNSPISIKRILFGVVAALMVPIIWTLVFIWAFGPEQLDPATEKALEAIARALVQPMDPAEEDRFTEALTGWKPVPEWSGHRADGTTITGDNLKEIFAKHERWQTPRLPKEFQADLTGASLENADLRRTKLRSAIFREANLTRIFAQKADLSYVDFVRANLTNAVLTDTDLTEAHFSEANLRGANFAGATFRSTWFSGADLRETWFSDATLDRVFLEGAKLQQAAFLQANLSGVSLLGADLTGAKFSETDMSDVTYEPLSGTLPDIAAFASAKNLSRMIYHTSPQALIELREAFKKAGFRRQESEVNYALMESRREKVGVLEKLVFLAIKIPCAYGMDPGRPLRILAALIFVFWVPYIFALREHGMAGIWKVWSQDRVITNATQVNERLAPRGIRRIATALYFSLLSAFNLGWREINVGGWIARVQPDEFLLKPTGWVRSVAGIQSLLSIYLVVLWVITYFNGPIGLM